ncbi:MAG TPA: biotin carboxylase N-terminal domain-containing protein [Ktedonobacterales bacterium]
MDSHVATPIHKVLIANRGEIACRIMRTCASMGIATVAVFSDADASARHVREADEAVRVGPSDAASSYLNVEALIGAARRTGADAIHPGYGFLAEDAAFAGACVAADLTFIGPAADVIARMGSKREAKRLAAEAGVPVIPGYTGDDQSDQRLLRAAEQVGYPLLVKASAGGGGKGMRIVEHAGELPDALAAARREALAAFGDDTLLLEELIRDPRHIEVQIFGDAHGHLVHLGERECSIQRRHQKIIEETPSTAVSPALRAQMTDAALAIGRQLQYTNAGTVEFVVAPDGSFYFLEVNTRLQVEHPVTELVTGLDLVRWQVLVAEGRPLPATQTEIAFSGHAIEARVYAEDPEVGFLPATGAIALWREPSGDGVRVDSGIQYGARISPYYDPLLAKISAHGGDRTEALRRLEWALAHTSLFGVRNNLSFLRRALLHPAHVAGAISTSFIATHGPALLAAPAQHAAEALSSAQIAAVVAAIARTLARPDPRGWRNNPYQPVGHRFTPLYGAANSPHRDAHPQIDVRLTTRTGSAFSVQVNGHTGARTVSVRVREYAAPDLWLEVDGHLLHTTALETEGHEWWVQVGTETQVLAWQSPFPAAEPDDRAGSTLSAPMPGTVVSVLVEVGQHVSVGQPLLVLQAMKMEHVIEAPFAGTVAALQYGPGDTVPARAVLLDLQRSEQA